MRSIRANSKWLISWNQFSDVGGSFSGGNRFFLVELTNTSWPAEPSSSPHPTTSRAIIIIAPTWSHHPTTNICLPCCNCCTSVVHSSILSVLLVVVDIFNPRHFYIYIDMIIRCNDSLSVIQVHFSFLSFQLPGCGRPGKASGVRRWYYFGSGVGLASDKALANLTPDLSLWLLGDQLNGGPVDWMEELPVLGWCSLSPPNSLTTAAPGLRLHYLNHHRTLLPPGWCLAQWGINWITACDPPTHSVLLTLEGCLSKFFIELVKHVCL